VANIAPPISDAEFWHAWAWAEGRKTHACKLLRIGKVRLERELARRGIGWRYREPEPPPAPKQREGRCVVCGDRLNGEGPPWGRGDDPRKHWTCEQWERGRCVLYEGPLALEQLL